jgi:hypothetical protein
MEFLFLAKFRQFKKRGGVGFSYINFGSELWHPFHTRRVGRWILPSVPSESILPSVPSESILPSVPLSSLLRPHLAESAVHSPFQSLLGWILPCVPFRGTLGKISCSQPIPCTGAQKPGGTFKEYAMVTPQTTRAELAFAVVESAESADSASKCACVQGKRKLHRTLSLHWIQHLLHDSH